MTLLSTCVSCRISIKTMTWPKDSYGLFDYQCKDAKKTSFESYEGFELMRYNDTIEKKRTGNVQIYNK